MSVKIYLDLIKLVSFLKTNNYSNSHLVEHLIVPLALAQNFLSEKIKINRNNVDMIDKFLTKQTPA